MHQKFINRSEDGKHKTRVSEVHQLTKDWSQFTGKYRRRVGRRSVMFYWSLNFKINQIIWLRLTARVSAIKLSEVGYGSLAWCRIEDAS